MPNREHWLDYILYRANTQILVLDLYKFVVFITKRACKESVNVRFTKVLVDCVVGSPNLTYLFMLSNIIIHHLLPAWTVREKVMMIPQHTIESGFESTGKCTKLIRRVILVRIRICKTSVD